MAGDGMVISGKMFKSHSSAVREIASALESGVISYVDAKTIGAAFLCASGFDVSAFSSIEYKCEAILANVKAILDRMEEFSKEEKYVDLNLNEEFTKLLEGHSKLLKGLESREKEKLNADRHKPSGFWKRFFRNR